MEYFLGGYMLMHCLPVEGLHPQLNGKPLLTCSTCFNESLLDDWSYQWLGFDRHAPYDANLTVSEHLAERFSIDDELWERIRIWSNEKYFSGHFGWPDIFVNSLIAT